MSLAATITPNVQAFYGALNLFIQNVTGLAASQVVQGLPNRAAMPLPGFISFQAITRRRLRWNLHTSDTTDQFVGTASVTSGSSTLTITAVTSGALAVGQSVACLGIPAGTTIAAFGTGTGGIGTYALSQNATANETDVTLVVGSQEPLLDQNGAPLLDQNGQPLLGPPSSLTILEAIELGIQIDCFEPQSTSTSVVGAEDWANMLSATLRDNYGCSFFEAQLGAGICDPLYADDARMVPFVDAEEQYEQKWSVDARFQLNPTTTIPQQYAAAVTLEMVEVPAEIT